MRTVSDSLSLLHRDEIRSDQITTHLAYVWKARSMTLTHTSVSNLPPLSLPCPYGSDSSLGESLKALAGILEALYSALTLSLSQTDTAPPGISPIRLILIEILILILIEYSAVLHSISTVPHCTVRYYTVLYCTELYNSTL